eukprot:scaffold29024_cov51-Phaeocystis_antarctica.AAC.4
MLNANLGAVCSCVHPIDNQTSTLRATGLGRGGEWRNIRVFVPGRAVHSPFRRHSADTRRVDDYLRKFRQQPSAFASAAR